MRKKSFILAVIMVIALNCNAQSSSGCYRGFIDAGYSIGVGDYEFGRFEVNTSHGFHNCNRNCSRMYHNHDPYSYLHNPPHTQHHGM